MLVEGAIMPARSAEACTVSILIPAFNEAEGIRDVVEALVARHPDAEILICDDGSSDGTQERLHGLPVIVLRHDRNRGYGAAWKTLATAATGDILVYIDGDGQFDSDDVARLLDAWRETGADMVSGRRNGGKGRPLVRRPGKWVMHRFAVWLTGARIPDVNCGLRLVARRDFRRFLPLLPDGFSCSTTSLLAYLASGRSVVFVPIEVRARVGVSSVRMVRDGLRSLMLIVRMTALFSPLRVFLPASLIMLVGGLSYSIYEAARFGLGIPVLGAIMLINGVVVFLFGVLADQVASVRTEQLGLRHIDVRHPIALASQED